MFKFVEYVIMVFEEGGVISIWGKEVRVILKEVKYYFKIDFKSYVGFEERCVDYCIGFSFSDFYNDVFV